MAITISQFPTVPALEYKHIHVSGLQISLDEAQTPKAMVSIVYKMYALDTDGKKHFAREQYTARVDDFYALAAEKAADGNMIPYQALVGIEQAVAAILADKGTHGAAVVE